MAPRAVGWGQVEGLWEKTGGVQCQAHLDTVWRQEDGLGTGLYDADPGQQAGDFLVLMTQAEGRGEKGFPLVQRRKQQ